MKRVMEEEYENNVSLLIDSLSVMQPIFREGISEYALIQALKQPPYEIFHSQALSDSLVLFKTHFILFHALYTLQGEWRQQGVGELDIHTTNIILHPYASSSSFTKVQSSTPNATNNIMNADPLARYYLDWHNFETTQKADVNALLDDFWSRMAVGRPLCISEDERQHAYRVLGITELALSEENTYLHLTPKTLKQYYRKALAKAHPDKGGSVKRAQAVIQAYRLLAG